MKGKGKRKSTHSFLTLQLTYHVILKVVPDSVHLCLIVMKARIKHKANGTQESYIVSHSFPLAFFFPLHFVLCSNCNVMEEEKAKGILF